LYTSIPSKRVLGAIVGSAVDDSVLLMIVWVDRLPGVQDKEIIPVPSGLRTGVVMKLEEVEPPEAVEPPNEGGLAAGVEELEEGEVDE